MMGKLIFGSLYTFIRFMHELTLCEVRAPLGVLMKCLLEEGSDMKGFIFGIEE